MSCRNFKARMLMIVFTEADLPLTWRDISGRITFQNNTKRGQVNEFNAWVNMKEDADNRQKQTQNKNFCHLFALLLLLLRLILMLMLPLTTLPQEPPHCSKDNNICSLSHLKNIESHVMAAPESYTKRR